MIKKHLSEQAALRAAKKLIKEMDFPQVWKPFRRTVAGGYMPILLSNEPAIEVRPPYTEGEGWLAITTETAGIADDRYDSGIGDTPQQAVNAMLDSYRARIGELFDQMTEDLSKFSNSRVTGPAKVVIPKLKRS